MSQREKIRKFVERLLAQNSDVRPIADSESLIISGRLQSIDAIEIVVFLEENFGINFEQVGFDRDQLDSVDAIDALVRSASGSRS
jgi:acyl carrier protein